MVVKTTRHLSIYSAEIAKFDTMSKGDDWRRELKAGDLVDAYDSTKVCFTSTVVNRELRYFDDEEIMFLKIGFRYYDQDGTK